jgi:hypothetical protein
VNNPYALILWALGIAGVFLMVFGVGFNDRALIKAGQVIAALAIGWAIGGAITGNRP